MKLNKQFKKFNIANKDKQIKKLSGSFEPPQMLHHIILQLTMSIYVSNFLPPSKKRSKHMWHLVVNICKGTLAIIWFSVKHWSLMFALNDHVVQDRTDNHDLPYLIFRPGKGKVPDNGKSSLQRTECPLHILPANLLLCGKPSFILSRHRVWDCLHKCWSSSVDATCQVVALVILVAIDLELHWRSSTFNKTAEHIWILQYVDVIVWSWHTKESMPNSHIQGCHNLKHHTTWSFMTFVHVLVREWTVLPCSVHTINASKHSWKTPSCILFQDPSCVFCIGCSQVFLPKHYHNCPAKPVYAVDGYGLGHVEIVVPRVSRNCICKHLESNYAFLFVEKPSVPTTSLFSLK
jgi:hypothetical protein